MLNYNLFRNNNLIIAVKGLQNIEKSIHRKFIALYPEIDIQINDILINTTTNIKYIILDTDSSLYTGTILQKKTYYQTPTYIEILLQHAIIKLLFLKNSIIGIKNLKQLTINHLI